MQSKMEHSTVLDILNMTYWEITIGHGDNNSYQKKWKNSNVVISDRNNTITLLRTNSNDKEWEEICRRNFQQATENGFSLKAGTNYLEYYCETNANKFKTLSKNGLYYNAKYEYISISRNTKEILLSVNNIQGWAKSSSEYYSIKPLIDSFNKIDQGLN